MVVGQVVDRGDEAHIDLATGQRVGIAWLRHVDGTCRFCSRGRENLCPNARFTGYHADGGYAEYAIVPADFAYPIPDGLEPLHAAPLLCAGIIGYRALKLSEVPRGGRLGVYGFGNSAHVTIQVALHWGCQVYVMTRGERHRALAADMGATWAGDATEKPPVELDSAIIFAPAGEIVPRALESLDRGGVLAIAGIYMTQIPSLDYERDLFEERVLRSVTANTREDGRELLQLAVDIPIRTSVQTFGLADANAALQALAADQIQGAGVIVV
jgi:propanol-preferring alcohol dehydrogenase